MADTGSTHDIDATVRAWLAGGAGRGVPADEICETHAAAVFLAGDRAFKIKKPVRLEYLDFSTVAKRGSALRRELERNSLSAPDMYLAVHAVRRADGGFTFGGDGEPVDYVLEMRRFDSDALLSRQPEIVRGDLAEHLGRRIARYHAAAVPMPELGGAASLAYSLEGNARELRRFAAVLGEDIVDGLLVELQAGFEAAAPLLDRRFGHGFGRRCHGDLHLKNIFLQGGVPVLFDCIEFDDRLSDIDVLYDLAFLLMDLEVRQQREGANRVLNGYLDEAARSFPEEMWEGITLLPLFLSMRAAVRAHVSARMKEPDVARGYAAAARRFIAPPGAALAAVGGLSGSGKTWFARVLAPLLGPAPGAVVLRSDEIRKRLWNVAPTVRLPPEAYSQDASARVYGQMMKEAEAVLRSGHAVVLDAVFLKEEERDRCATLAERCDVHFAGVWLEAPGEVLRKRIDARSGDASDANVAVLEEQLTRDPGPVAWRKLSATGDVTAQVRVLAEHLG